MPKRTLIPIALILMIILAACGGQTAEPSQAEVVEAQPETAVMAADEEMADESHDDDMDEMTEESHDDDMNDMAEESHDDDMDDMADESHEDELDDMEEEGHDEDMDEEGHDEAMEGEGHDDDMDAVDGDSHDADEDGAMAAESSDAGMAAADLAAWQTVSLTNAITGEPFTLADFQGKTVFVEPMATWCSNCARQQGEVRKAKEQLGEDVVFFGLSLETNLPAAQLAAYAQGNGFDWNYAVMSPELLQGLADEFGRSITSAPSTPHFLIRPDGSYTGLATGIHSADEIISEIQAEQG